MGFNKGIITKEKIDNKYKSSGVEGVKKLLNSYDAFYIKDDYSSEVIKYYNNGDIESFFGNKEG